MPGTYQIDSSLVHKILLSIIASIVAVGGYMIVWAYLDARWKGELDVKMEQIQRYVTKLDDHIAKPCHDVACERIQGLQKHRDIGH
jgi:hypothetical protein